MSCETLYNKRSYINMFIDVQISMRRASEAHVCYEGRLPFLQPPYTGGYQRWQYCKRRLKEFLPETDRIRV